MIILAVISLIGLIFAIVLHLCTIVEVSWLSNNIDPIYSIMFISGSILMLLTIIKAWDWSLGSLIGNITDGMSGLAKNFMILSILYPCIINGTAKGQVPNATIFGISSILFPIFLIPALYFWKERPEDILE